MKHRIAAAVIVDNSGRILPVRQYWKDRENGLAFSRYVGLRAMEFS
jgi:hypothetical protein